LWDDFGIKEAKMSGFWDASCPVKVKGNDVFATAYLRKGRTLVSVASWAPGFVTAKLEIDFSVLGLDQSKTVIYAPPIKGFQPETIFKHGDDLPVAPGKGWLLLVDEQERQLSAPIDLTLGRKLLWEELFADGQLTPGWRLADPQTPRAAIGVTNGLVINAAANAAVFAERHLPSAVSLVTCAVAAQTDQGASWGPGMALVWPDGKVLRVNVRAEGRFGVDDGKRQFLEGFCQPGRTCDLSIVLEKKEVAVFARQQNEAWQELVRLPRSEFPADPSAVRVGKMSPGGKKEDFATIGPAGQCWIGSFRVFGTVGPEGAERK
jgi:hypothetical protein